jgi:hypothetical protein
MMRLRRPLFGLLLVAFAASCTDSTGVIPFGDGASLMLSVVGPQAVSQNEMNALGDAFDQVDEYQVLIVDAGTGEFIAADTITITSGLSVHTLPIDVPEDIFRKTVTITLIALAGGVELYRSVTTETISSTGFGGVEVQLEIRYTGPGVRGTVADATGAPVAGVTVGLYQGQSMVTSVPTEDDGTYLFVDVVAGLYEVQPTPSVGFVCPMYRDVDATSPDAVIIADFTTSASPCNPVVDVLVLSGGDFDDTGVVEALLANNQNLNVSTFFFLAQPPGIDFLSNFDVVFVFMNGLFDEPASVGTEIADYLALGGNVVIGSFYWQGRSDSGLGSTGWGNLENFDPYTSTGGATYTLGNLNTGNIVAHPLTTGLSALTSTGYWGGVVPKTSATVVAEWADGTPSPYRQRRRP